MDNIVYNVTIKLDKNIAQDWLQWLLKDHAPQIIATGCFTKFIVLKLLEHEEDGISYAVQYFSENMQKYQRYQAEFSDRFRKESSDKWGNKFISFRTVMQVVN